MCGFQELELFDRSAHAEYEANLFAAELLDFKFRLLKTRGLRMESPLTSPADFPKKELPECFEPEYGFEGA